MPRIDTSHCLITCAGHASRDTTDHTFTDNIRFQIQYNMTYSHKTKLKTLVLTSKEGVPEGIAAL